MEPNHSNSRLTVLNIARWRPDNDDQNQIKKSKFIYIAYLKTTVLIEVLHKLGNK